MPEQSGTPNPGTGVLAKHNSDIAVCILAAGIAKRLEPLSSIIAKPAFPLAGRIPIAELWVRRFADAGITRLAMNLHRAPHSLRSHFEDGKRFGADITYVDEDQPSGTLGGAIKMVRALQQKGVHPKRVFIPSGDIVSGIGIEHLEEMLEQHIKHGAAFSLMLAPIPWQRRIDFGTVVLEGMPPKQNVPAGTYARVEQFIEKIADSPSNENNASNYLVETDCLLELEPYLTEAKPGLDEPCYDFGKHMLTGISGQIPYLDFLAKRRADLYGYEPGRPWFDVGSKRDYLAVNKAILGGEIDVTPPYRRVPWGWMGENTSIELDRLKIKAPVVIGDNCVVCAGAEIGPNAVISDGWVIRQGAKVKDAVLWPHCGDGVSATPPECAIGEGVRVDNAIVAGGEVTFNVREETVHVLPNGEPSAASIDWVPEGERA